MAKQTAKGRKTPTKSQKEKPKKVVEEAPETPTKPDVSTESVTPDEQPKVEDAVVVEPAKKDTATDIAEKTADEPVVETVIEEKPVAEDAKTTAEPTKPTPVPTPPPPAESEGAFLPLVLGGVIAGAIGFAGAYFTLPQADTDLPTRLARQASQITELESQIAAIPRVDLSTVETAQADVSARVTAIQNDLDQAVDTFDNRITTLERQPSGDGTLQATALAAYQADLDALREQMEATTDDALAQLEDVRADALAIERNAATAVRAAALGSVQNALETGEPLGAALAELESVMGVAAPPALVAVQDGVPTLSSLQADFPSFARNALDTARREKVSGEETTGFGAFLRDQFDVRSVAPREGSDADAVLSRAQGALSTGRLNDTLAELAALPEVARAEMTDWLARAELRADAFAAVDILSTSLNDN